MKKVVLFLVMFGFLVGSMPVAAQAQGAEDLLFMEIPSVTSVSKAEQGYSEVPMSVYVISREELERWGVRNLYETMQRVPGFSFYNTDYYGQYGVMARGYQSIWRYGSSIELMPIVDFGHWEFTPLFFKNIEIARGPAGLMWGSNAEAGLMNFNIRDDLSGLETAVEYGEVGRRALDVMYGDRLNTGKEGDCIFLGWHYERQGFKTQTNNSFYADNAVRTDWKENGLNDSQTFLGKLQYKEVKFLAFYNHADTIAPRLWFRGSTGGDDVETALNNLQGNVHDELPLLTLRGEYHVPEEHLARLNTKLYFYGNYYKKQWYIEGLALDTQINQTAGINAETTVQEGRWKLLYGGDLIGEERTTAPSFTSPWADDNYGIDWYGDSRTSSKRAYRNFYLQSENRITDKFMTILGARLDWQKDGEPETILSGPRAALIFSPRENLTLKYLHNMGVRRPQANEITGSSPAAERMNADELVLMGNVGDKFQGSLSLYVQQLQNKITRIEDGSLNYFENTGGISSRGLEWDLKYKPVKKLLVYYNGSFIAKCEVLIDNILDQEPHDDQMRSLFVPLFSHFVGAEYDFDRFKANLDLRSIANIPYQKMDLSYSEKSVHFVDLTLRSQKLFNERIQFSLNCLNLFNEQSQVPAFGEHSGNGRGTMAPESRRIYGRMTVAW